ncbi:nucleotidyl transferase AbiEii/AbiGii toxin family protein [Olivibacter jilunii]|uniref:nucleotidyl transferase AbiEii/AbiGii toxin family protein n=1 Tax=Olivibacter jilunii TaxID=985016 RepID=UPI003F145D6C
MSSHTNIVRIKAVNDALEELRDQVVFVGGATVSLYADRPVLEVRPTDDIDVIIEILNYKQRQQLEERLREIGFTNDVESGVICRFKIHGIIVDIMPTDDPSIGFNNKWYPKGYEHAQVYKLDERQVIRILTAPYFLATKLEAFKGRGGGDGRLSHDFEDIVFVLENRASLWDELEICDDGVKTYLVTEFSALMNNPYISEWIDSHVERGSIPLQTSTIIENIKNWLIKTIRN